CRGLGCQLSGKQLSAAQLFNVVEPLWVSPQTEQDAPWAVICGPHRFARSRHDLLLIASVSRAQGDLLMQEEPARLRVRTVRRCSKLMVDAHEGTREQLPTSARERKRKETGKKVGPAWRLSCRFLRFCRVPDALVRRCTSKALKRVGRTI